ncbi:hypothetical protein NE237_023059 [Protea cynaroides]|uniref:Uncharacterized protein n=1 Tax=Protea cynaroides TaxID=273540 RepID=A0A9Q0HC87_9MAGN|nr:hypothetical protein NE237_023059 [Protea cynaroides]
MADVSGDSTTPTTLEWSFSSGIGNGYSAVNDGASIFLTPCGLPYFITVPSSWDNGSGLCFAGSKLSLLVFMGFVRCEVPDESASSCGVTGQKQGDNAAEE